MRHKEVGLIGKRFSACGGSLLSIGSAAGVALMGIGRGVYTFSARLKWTWEIMLGFVASIAVHLVMNRDIFTQ